MYFSVGYVWLTIKVLVVTEYRLKWDFDGLNVITCYFVWLYKILVYAVDCG